MTPHATYQQLFKEAHAALQKEARTGMFRRWLGRLADPDLVQRAESLTERTGHQDVALKGLKDQLASSRFNEAAQLSQMQQLADEVATYGNKPGALRSATAQRNAALGLGAVGLGVGVPAAYVIGNRQGAGDTTRTRNLAFGAGAAAGLAAPQMISALGNIARGANRTGVFPEFDGLDAGGYTV